MHVNYKGNAYADWVQLIYQKTPKAVFAAIAVSHVVNWVMEGNSDVISEESVSAEILKEWEILYTNGIVPQKPPSMR